VKQLAVKMLLMAILMYVAVEYSYWTWDIPTRAEAIVMGLEDRPYVYRSLVPVAARMLVWMGLEPGAALTMVVVVSMIGLFYGLNYFFKSIERE
jgi:hypothetical protein